MILEGIFASFGCLVDNACPRPASIPQDQYNRYAPLPLFPVSHHRSLALL
jgi:hypothetical protein